MRVIEIVIFDKFLLPMASSVFKFYCKLQREILSR